ncbi:MAG: hypothetical protein A2687_05850 [Candidatus Levybacteria bacterium RIFCSPHIGHO2_01_FULL_38_26]|nr:MAG: hypothetical protein A2687_05850 [Candidatus Levybacteria bacterium RIFCSPHIGHO2_01_FULL_38_26]
MNKYKNNNENNYALVVRALQKGYVKYPGTWTRLYLTKENKLSHLSYQEAKDIIDSMSHDGLIELNHYAKASDLLTSRNPTPLPKGAREIVDNDDWPYWIFPFNYFSVGIEEKFNKVTSLVGSPLFLLSVIPREKKYKYLLRMARSLIEAGVNNEVENYKLAVCFDSRLNKNQYINNRVKKLRFNNLIENRLKTLRKLLRLKGYTFKFNQHNTKLVKI